MPYINLQITKGATKGQKQQIVAELARHWLMYTQSDSKYW